MKFLFLFFFALSCNNPDQQSSEMPPTAEDGGLDGISGSRESGQPRKVSVAENTEEREKRKKQNPLREEEIYLTRQRRRAQRRFRGFSVTNKQNTAVHTICRRFEGCQKFCADWLNQNTKCNQWSISTVVKEWAFMLDSLNSEQVIANAQWVALHPDVSIFLREADPHQDIMSRLISRLSYESCPFSEGLDIYHRNASLYLIHPESTEQEERKKITDPNVDVDVFRGSVKKCLDDKQLSVSELMLVLQNTVGFQLMHRQIAVSCAHSEGCIQLAYCKINSGPVWTHLEQVKYSDVFNVEVQSEKCSYEDFNSLPSIQL